MSKTYPSKAEQDEYEGFVRAATGKKKDQPSKGKKAPPKGPSRGTTGKQFNDRMNSKNC